MEFNFLSSKLKKFIGIGLISYFITGCGGSQNLLIDHLGAKNMSELTLNLFQQGIVSNVERQDDGTYNVYIEKKDYPLAREILVSAGVFRDDNRDNLLKLATKTSMVENPVEQRFKFNQILAQELASTLSNLHNVINADVYLSADFDDSNNMGINSSSGENLKASIYLRVNPSSSTNPNALINNAKKIVAGAVKGLTADNIYVVIENS